MVNKTFENKNYFTVKELADTIGVSRITVFNRIKKGLIKAEKIGRNYIIYKKDVAMLAEDLDETVKKNIDTGVRLVVSEYGETLKLLGRE